MNVKQQILFIICLFLTLSTQAQELTIKEMKATNDLSASTYERKDLNKNSCALVKVQLAAYGAQFEGNVIGDVAYKTGEYWVYMTEGSRELRIKHPNYLPLHVNFADYGVERGLMGKQTYTLTLVMPQTIATNVDDGMRYLQLTVEPANAMVYIDDQPQQLTGGAANILLVQGSHTYRVEASGYLSETGTVIIGEQKVQKTIRLQSLQAQVTINCPTNGAQIYINDQLRGTTPWNGSLFPGNYAVEARLKDHRTQRQSISLQQREQRTVNLPALIAISGNLNVNYLPGDAEVYIDGRKVGTSPDIFRNITIGNHQIEIRKQGYASEQKTITINEGQTAQLNGSLNKIATPTQSSVSTSTSSASSSSTNLRFRTVKDYTLISGQQLQRYSVVVGSFSTQANAEGLAKTLTNKGYSPTIIKESTGTLPMFRIIGVTTNEQNEVSSLRNKFLELYPGCWLMENPNAKVDATATNTTTTTTQYSPTATIATTPKTGTVFFKKNDLFESEDSYSLSAAGKKALGDIANTLKQYRQCHVNFSVYYKQQKGGRSSESAYRAAYANAKISEGRKDAIVNYLTSQGIEQERIHNVYKTNNSKADAELTVFVP